MKIIIAGSDSIIAEDLRLMMKNAGYTSILQTTTGEETIEKVKEFEPDIVILDIYLTGKIDGKIVAKEIKKISKSTIMFYSTIRDMQTIQEIQSVTAGSVIDSHKLLFGLDDEKQIISNVEKVMMADVLTKEILKEKLNKNEC